MRTMSLALCLSACLPSLAQQHTTFPNVNATFEYTQWCALPQGGGYMQTFTYNYSFQPVIEVDSLSWSAIVSGYGLVAVDGDRIFYRGDHMLLQDTTLVLYDFSLNVGDTAYFDNYLFLQHAIVSTIDTVTISGQQRRRFMLDNDDVWIQGMGSLMGFFRPIMPTPLGCAFSSYTFCGNYIDDDGGPYTMCSDFTLALDERTQTPLSIHPGPSNGAYVVNGTQNGMPFTIHDMGGRVVHTGTFSHGSSTIQLQNVRPGVYLLKCGTTMLRFFVE